MAITAKSRAQVALQATTTLDAETTLGLVKQATGNVKGGGKSLLTSGIANLGAGIHVEAEKPDQLGLSITSGKRVVELCTFSATVNSSDGRTSLRVGGLEHYKTSQPRVAGFIPSGPKSILGYDPYRRYLDAVKRELLARDPSAEVTIAERES
jgi:hypothetical protein